MHIGLGASALNRGLYSGHLDGIGVYTRHLLDGLRARQQALTPYVFPGDARQGLAEGFARFPAAFGTNLALSSLLGTPFIGSGRLQCDLFHATDHRIPRLKHIPVVATLMDPIPLMRQDWVTPRFRSVKNMLFRRSVQWADRVIAISEYAAGDLVEYFRIPRERITVIPLGVDPQCFHPVLPGERERVLQRHGLRPGFFLFIGTLQPRKNLDRLLDAYLSLPPALRDAHPLVLVGRHGWGVDALVRRLQALRESGAPVRWLDYVAFEEKYALMQSAQALVFPSLYEGFGLPVLEAFAAGLPVITSTTSALPEVAGDAACLVNPERSDEIAAAMEAFVHQPAMTRQLVAQGLARARDLSWDRCVDQTQALYQALLA